MNEVPLYHHHHPPGAPTRARAHTHRSGGSEAENARFPLEAACLPRSEPPPTTTPDAQTRTGGSWSWAAAHAGFRELGGVRVNRVFCAAAQLRESRVCFVSRGFTELGGGAQGLVRACVAPPTDAAGSSSVAKTAADEQKEVRTSVSFL